MYHTGKKEISKKKKKKKRVSKNLLPWDSNSDPQNQLELKVNASIHWTTSVNVDAVKRGIYRYSSSMVTDSFQEWLFRVFLISV